LTILLWRLVIMTLDLKNFWQRLQSGIEVAVAGPSPEKLLGVRDGFLRFFRDGRGRPGPQTEAALRAATGQMVSIAVVPQSVEEAPLGLPITDEEVLRLLRSRVGDLELNLAGTYHFFVATEGGLHSLEIDGMLRYFVRNWTVVRGPLGEAWGSSGSIQLPDRIVAGLDSEQVPFAIPGTRKRGGMISSLTNSLETRREAVAVSTLHALSTLFYGFLETR
jgi:non-canonical (house-cleaning) NTP pyrophosphatase